MMKKLLAGIVVVGAMVFTGYAETVRPVFTLENRFPEAMQLEVGVRGTYEDYSEDAEHWVLEHNVLWAVPYARFGLLENLAATIEAPFGNLDSKFGKDGSGFGDVAVGLQFKAYEDIFHFPFIIPHAEARFKSGDEDKGLGDGANSLSCGVSVGSVMYEEVTLVVDGTYKFIENINRNYKLSGAVIWDLDEQFALLAEGYVASEKREEWGSARKPVYGQAGMSYKANEDLQITLLGGGGRDGAPSVSATFKVAYTF